MTSVPASLTITIEFDTASTEGPGGAAKSTSGATTTNSEQAGSTNAGNAPPDSVATSIGTGQDRRSARHPPEAADLTPNKDWWYNEGPFVDPEDPDRFLPPIVPGANVTTQHVAPPPTPSINGIPTGAAQGRPKLLPFALAAAVGGAAAAAAIGGVPQ